VKVVSGASDFVSAFWTAFAFAENSGPDCVQPWRKRRFMAAPRGAERLDKWSRGRKW
jgi:hypothetical protein